MIWQSTLDNKARLRRNAGLDRTLRVRAADDPLIDLAGNDYLGLARHPTVTAAAAEALAEYGLGAGGSRLVRGTTDAHVALENRLGELLGGAALVYSSGYLANLGAIRALCDASTMLVRDAHAHASLIDGCQLAGARLVTMPHNDIDALDRILAGHNRRSVVVVESVYSVDGDLAPLAELHRVCRAHGAILLVDEAHAVGVLGPGGAGASAASGLKAASDLVITATLSKALGSAGGVVAGPAELRRHLVDTGRTFIFDTAPPPAVAAGALAALELAAADDELRAEVSRRASAAAERLGVAAPAAGVVSVPASDPHAALEWARRCAEAGVAVGCFRPPSTPDGSSRLRLTVNAGIPVADFNNAIDVIERERP
ncbi:8-amino-7-oxononanoate synthase [Stackebrandtia nassauensis]|uniref:8-amino-7-oxononanoate synthase n=1 Tax=Stackebrandtia nassauensis (strain DSM 44728 / CIP 108903 / NRRL B-16338 / NBRC 102104 / LLR-40K-21) TaxID=446470 RepID=D3Q4M6_STANL|nr:8-amino-7-oxononanoate synthase [Stackebrandtia nassauensis]ADD40186.1 8-amino-7-oxononanoate synthase [Stackebrandtia nassauensis DSM 44728]